VLRLGDSPEVALDTEGDSLHHYPERLALVQVADVAGDAWLVDPLALTDLGAFAHVTADPRVTVVLHAGSNDLVHLKRRHGFTFARIFDTSIAARFLGMPNLGLDAVLAAHLGVELPPSRQRDDWSVRPLSEAQERYALADVLHLIPLAHRLREELSVRERLAWVEEECATLAAQPATERDSKVGGDYSIAFVLDQVIEGRALAAFAQFQMLGARGSSFSQEHVVHLIR